MGVGTLHVTFSPAAMAFLGEALKQAGRSDKVVGLFDAFEIGPINPPDPNDRQVWCESHSGFEDWKWPHFDAQVFWQHALSSRYRRKVVWLLRRSAHDYASFLECLWRLGDTSCEIIDVTDVRLQHPGHDPYPVLTLSGLTDDDILGAGLLESTVELQPGDRQRYRDLWAPLRIENAPLRVRTREGLVSGPITYFDEMLLSHVTRQWQSAEVPVIQATIHFAESEVWQAEMLFLAARVRALVRAGKIEARGDLSDERNCELRLPA